MATKSGRNRKAGLSAELDDTITQSKSGACEQANSVRTSDALKGEGPRPLAMRLSSSRAHTTSAIDDLQLRVFLQRVLSELSTDA